MLVTRQLRQGIWSKAVTVSRSDDAQDTARLLLPALNDMFAVSTVRTVTMYARLPNLIFALLVLVALLSSSLAGYGVAERKKRSWFHVLLFAGAVAITVYAVLDLDDSRVGLIRLDSARKRSRSVARFNPVKLTSFAHARMDSEGLPHPYRADIPLQSL